MIPRPDFFFLPGITGDGEFWRPVAEQLHNAGEPTYISYPGLGLQPSSPTIHSASDLLAMAEAKLTQLPRPCVIVAQSMGGTLAVQLAHRHPALVTHLVLVATSGGFDTRRYGATDWRADFITSYPATPAWALAPGPDLTPALAELRMPVLLIWGDQDDISPVAAGEFLAGRIPNAEMHVIKGGEHWLAKQFPEQVAALIDSFVP